MHATAETMGHSPSLGQTLKEWIFTTDHKRIGILYLIGSLAAFIVAGLMALFIRMELSNVGPDLTSNPQTYNVWLYFHGAAMILAFQIPALTGFLANFAAPLMIGAKDMAFPRLNALSLWLYWGGIIVALLTFVIPDPPDVMWTGYPPYSLATGGNTAFYVFAVHLFGFSSIAGGVNLITTILYMRAPGMTFNKLNIFVWSLLSAFIIQLVFVPVLAAAVTTLLFDKYLGTHFYDPGNGGDVLIYQNLFWFYSHPAVYVILLPAIGMIFDIVATFARNAIFNYKMVVYGGMGGIVLISGEVWIHHLFVSGMPNWIRIGMMISTLLISVPVGLLMIGLVGTLYRGAIEYKTPMLYAVGFIFVFLVGGLTGIPFAMTAIDIHLSDTQFVTAHFHYVMAVSVTFAIFGGIFYLFPKMFGRMYNESLGQIGFYIFFIGVNVTFLSMFIVGLGGMPRRYYDYQQFPQLQWWQQMTTYGSYLIGIGVAVNLIAWVHGLIAGKKAPDNPWGSKSLEWTTSTPPPPGNFHPVPTLSEEWSPYGYGKSE